MSLLFEPPPYVVFGLTDHGPHVWTFETALEVASYMWGKTLPNYAIFKNGVLGDYGQKAPDMVDRT